MEKSNKYGELFILYFVLILGLISMTIIDFGVIGLILKLIMILITILVSVITISNRADENWKKIFIDGNIMKKIKDYHVKICIAILIIPSLFMLVAGLTFKDLPSQTISWWFALLYGWSGLVVSLKLGKVLYKDR